MTTSYSYTIIVHHGSSSTHASITSKKIKRACSVQDFYNEKAYERCASARIPVPFNPSVDILNDGWQNTLDLISKQAALLTDEAQS